MAEANQVDAWRRTTLLAARYNSTTSEFSLNGNHLSRFFFHVITIN
jgi:hypothetical protein